mgnify:CR=1 FL=1
MFPLVASRQTRMISSRSISRSTFNRKKLSNSAAWQRQQRPDLGFSRQTERNTTDDFSRYELPQRYPESKVYSEWKRGKHAPAERGGIYTANRAVLCRSWVARRDFLLAGKQGNAQDGFHEALEWSVHPQGTGGRLTRVTKLRFNEIKHRIGGGTGWVPSGPCIYSPRAPGRPACKNLFIESTGERKYVLLFYAMEILRGVSGCTHFKGIKHGKRLAGVHVHGKTHWVESVPFLQGMGFRNVESGRR